MNPLTRVRSQVRTLVRAVYFARRGIYRFDEEDMDGPKESGRHVGGIIMPNESSPSVCGQPRPLTTKPGTVDVCGCGSRG